eukprot:2282387-Karenia_brevis.AAC.1
MPNPSFRHPVLIFPMTFSSTALNREGDMGSPCFVPLLIVKGLLNAPVVIWPDCPPYNAASTRT